MNEFILKCLTANGWYPERCLHITNLRYKLIEKGWELFEEGLLFIFRFAYLIEFSY